MDSAPTPPRRPATIAPEDRIGTIVQGEYHIETLLGEEDLGPLYEANNPRRKAKFAVVMLRREISPPLKTMLAVRDDLRRARELGSQGLIPIEQVADGGGVTGFATEMLTGERLRQRLQRGPMRAEPALALLGVLGRALRTVHEARLIHGDLRPDHIFLVNPDAKHVYAGRAMLLGHSLYRLRQRPDVNGPKERLLYTPPELVAGEGTASAATDIFALGAILYECLTGTPAFAGETAAEVVERLAQPPPLLAANPLVGLTEDLVKTLNVVIAGACARDVQTRIPSMDEFVNALQQVARGTGMAWPDEEGTGRRQVSIVRRLTGMLFAPPVRAPRPPLPARPARKAANLPGEGPAPAPDPVAPAAPAQAAAAPAAPAIVAGPPGEGPMPAPATTAPAEGTAPAPDAALSLPDETIPMTRAEISGMGLNLSAALPAEGPGASSSSPAPLPPPPDARVASRPPPLPPALGKSGRSPPLSQRPTQPPGAKGEALQRESTMLLSRSRVTRQATDMTQLIAAVQEGRMDPITAVQQAQEGEEIILTKSDLLPPSFRLLLQRKEVVAMMIGAAVVILLGLILMKC